MSPFLKKKWDLGRDQKLPQFRRNQLPRGQRGKTDHKRKGKPRKSGEKEGVWGPFAILVPKGS